MGIQLNGVAQGILRSADGGDTFADVITETGDQLGKKHIGSPKYEDFSVEFGFGLGLDFYEWVVGIGGGQEPVNGTIVTTDLQLNVKSARGFQQALLTELAIPALDAASKNPGFLTLSFAPQTASDLVPTGKLTTIGGAQKVWLTSNFRLEIDGITGEKAIDCTKVSKIESITIKRNNAENQVDYSNLVVTFNAVSLGSWKSWFDDFVLNGNNDDAHERMGRLRLLTNTGTDLAVLQLHHIGIFKLDPDPEPAPGQDAVARAKAELYVEAMNFTQLGSWTLT